VVDYGKAGMTLGRVSVSPEPGTGQPSRNWKPRVLGVGPTFANITTTSWTHPKAQDRLQRWPNYLLTTTERFDASRPIRSTPGSAAPGIYTQQSISSSSRITMRRRPGVAMAAHLRVDPARSPVRRPTFQINSDYDPDVADPLRRRARGEQRPPSSSTRPPWSGELPIPPSPLILTRVMMGSATDLLKLLHHGSGRDEASSAATKGVSVENTDDNHLSRILRPVLHCHLVGDGDQCQCLSAFRESILPYLAAAVEPERTTRAA